MRVKALVVHEKNGPYCMEDVELDEPKDNEVLVRNVASGICHTDEFGRSQGVPIALPLVLGHEGAGIVERVEGGVIYTVEGNADDRCIENHYFLDSAPVYGFGLPTY